MASQVLQPNNNNNNILSPSSSQTAFIVSTTKMPKIGSDENVPNTLLEALRVFFFSLDGIGPLIISVVLLNLYSWRLQGMGVLTVADALAFFGCILFWSFQEHVLHGKLLHSDVDWYGKQIHQEHHEKPYFHVSIDPPALMIAWMASAHLILRTFLPLPVAISATLGYATAGLFYEWAHYIVHTKVKPRSKFMKQMRDNHIRHHNVDHRYWLAFSIPAVDDFFGTNPDVQEVRRQNKQQQNAIDR